VRLPCFDKFEALDSDRKFDIKEVNENVGFGPVVVIVTVFILNAIIVHSNDTIECIDLNKLLSVAGDGCECRTTSVPITTIGFPPLSSSRETCAQPISGSGEFSIASSEMNAMCHVATAELRDTQHLSITSSHRDHI
jgi:hypothetical protein